jgi:hypothetical protein
MIKYVNGRIKKLKTGMSILPKRSVMFQPQLHTSEKYIITLEMDYTNEKIQYNFGCSYIPSRNNTFKTLTNTLFPL